MRIELKWYKIVCLISMIVLLNCNIKNAIGENNQVSNIKDGAVVLFSEYEFIIKFTNLIYEKDGKELKIPIFQGNMGDVYYKAFHEYCYDNNLLKRGWGESSFVIKAEKGMLTKTFREFLMFYKGNILKNADISKPVKIKADGGALDIFYDFKIDGVPFVLHLNISTGTKDIDTRLIKSIFDVNLNENMGIPTFRYRFWKNKTSKEF